MKYVLENKLVKKNQKNCWREEEEEECDERSLRTSGDPPVDKIFEGQLVHIFQKSWL